MLVFIDESGDCGIKIDSGSSRYFVVGMVIFEDNDEAEACDRRIELLKKELGWKENSEFHFSRNSNRVREIFLHAVAPYNFFYYGFCLNKDPKYLYGPGFKIKASFYKYVSSLVFENAKTRLINATVIIDRSGNETFRSELAIYLRKKMNDPGCKRIKKLKMQRSHSNNLLQLADYVSSIIARSIIKKEAKNNPFRKIISHREMDVQVWPK